MSVCLYVAVSNEGAAIEGRVDSWETGWRKKFV